MSPTGKTYFSGVEGLGLGMLMSGCTISQSLEYDKNCIATLTANFSHKIISDDIRGILVMGQEKTDFSTFTYPCTKYSSIADIHRTRTGDELFLHALRHIAIDQPEMYVVENVPGMKKFPVVMEAMTKLPGYHMNIFCPLDANNWLPQHRKRLILIATKKPFLIFDPTGSGRRRRLKDILEKDVQIEIPDYVVNRIKGKYRDLPIISDPSRNDIAPTCVAHYHKDISTRLVRDDSYPFGVRPYTVREYARLQGFPDSFKFIGGDAQAYKQIGNAVAVDVGRWIGEQVYKYFNRAA